MQPDSPLYTKESLIAKLKAICAAGWHTNARHGNHGGVGNTLEDLLGIKENNLPIPNAAEWELKTQRLHSIALVTLCHSEPSPRAIRFVPAMLLPRYGWAHKQAGEKYGIGEMSFRQTISAKERSDRGFKVVVDRVTRKVLVSFDALSVDPRHGLWLGSVKQRVGHLNELEPQPYWGFDDLQHDAGAKLTTLSSCRPRYNNKTARRPTAIAARKCSQHLTSTRCSLLWNWARHMSTSTPAPATITARNSASA